MVLNLVWGNKIPHATEHLSPCTLELMCHIEDPTVPNKEVLFSKAAGDGTDLGNIFYPSLSHSSLILLGIEVWLPMLYPSLYPHPSPGMIIQAKSLY